MSDALVDPGALAADCARIGGAGFRGTATPAHEDLIDWIEQRLRAIPGMQVRDDRFPVRRWTPVGGLESAARIDVDGVGLRAAGAVPYSAPAAAAGPVVVLEDGEPITAERTAGCIVVRDFPKLAIPYDWLLDGALHLSPGTERLRGRTWDRPGLADSVLHADLLAAGEAGAAGVVFAFDLPREQIAGYFEPHRGTHYATPAAFVGAAERRVLRAGSVAAISVDAIVDEAPTRNLIATLPGSSPERVILVTHTDGATWVQENGIAALLAIAEALAAEPIRRTVEFAFTTAHLHISREGSVRFADQLDRSFDVDDDLALVVALEHLGVRALEPVPDGDDRRLEFSGDAELGLWAVGPSSALRQAVIDAVDGRGLPDTAVLEGLGAPVEGQVPPIASFGGLGTPFHQALLPTTSLITGPWSLWAPSFGAEAVDVELLRLQTLAAIDLVRSLDEVSREDLIGDCRSWRLARAAGAARGLDEVPPEVVTKAPTSGRAPFVP